MIHASSSSVSTGIFNSNSHDDSSASSLIATTALQLPSQPLSSLPCMFVSNRCIQLSRSIRRRRVLLLSTIQSSFTSSTMMITLLLVLVLIATPCTSFCIVDRMYSSHLYQSTSMLHSMDRRQTQQQHCSVGPKRQRTLYRNAPVLYSTPTNTNKPSDDDSIVIKESSTKLFNRNPAKQSSKSQSKNNANDPKSRRRFAQIVHDNNSFKADINSNSNDRSIDNSNDQNNSNRKPSPSDHENNRQKSTTRSTTSTATKNRNDPIKNVKNTKSIDELEGSLLKRWGTDLSAWTARDMSDDDEDDYEYERKEDSTNSIRKAVSSSSMFRAKPVKDPFMIDEDENDVVNNYGMIIDASNDMVTKKKKRIISPSPSSLFTSQNEKSDPMLRRVQMNQQRLLQQKQQPNVKMLQPQQRIPSTANNIVDADEGMDRSGTSTNRQSTDNKDNNIRNENPLTTSKNQVDGRRTVLPMEKPTYFFSEPERIVSSSSSATFTSEIANDNTKITTKRVVSETQMLFNNDDNTPMYLTIEQAERNFRRLSLASPNTLSPMTSSDGIDDDSSSTLPGATEQIQNNNVSTKLSSSWQDLGITHPTLLRTLSEKMKCNVPLYVQQKACPEILDDTKDVLIGTYTGSGKTLSFLVPSIQRLLNDRATDNNGNNDSGSSAEGTTAFLKILIIAPGRELASQIVSVTREVVQDIPDMNVMLAIGGTTYTRNLEQIRKRKPCIIVGTPGRIAELIVGRPGEKNGRLKTSALQTLILDEFDALLEYNSHRDPTDAIVQLVQKQRRQRLQSIFCSATTSDMIGSMKLKQYLRPGYVTVLADKDDTYVTNERKSQKYGLENGSDDSAETSSSIQKAATTSTARVSRTVIHGVVHVEQKRFVLDTIRKILHTNPIPQQILLFVENARKVDIMVEKLEEMNIIAAPLHGGFGSEKGDRAYVSQALRDGYVGIVVATEIAARGLDAPLLTHVINVDLPTDPSHYAHRAGRCGRGTRPGVVVNLTSSPAERAVPKKLTSALDIPLYTVEVKNGKLNIIDPNSQDLDM